MSLLMLVLLDFGFVGPRKEWMDGDDVIDND